MATNVTPLVAGVFIPELWLPIVQEARDASLVAAKRSYDISGFGDVRSKGDIVHVPKLSLYTATDKTSNTELPSSATTESEFTLTVNKHKGVRIAVEDIARAQSAYNLVELYGKRIGQALAKVLDTDILALYSGLSQTVGATASSDGGISDTNVLRAIRFLDGANAPQDNRSVIVESYGMEDLRLIDKFVRYDALGAGNMPIRDGMIGKLYGIDVFASENVQTTSVVGGTLARGLVMHREAFAFATQMSPKIEQWRNAPQLADEIIGQELYGVAEYRDDHGVVLRYPKA